MTRETPVGINEVLLSPWLCPLQWALSAWLVSMSTFYSRAFYCRRSTQHYCCASTILCF